MTGAVFGQNSQSRNPQRKLLFDESMEKERRLQRAGETEEARLGGRGGKKQNRFFIPGPEPVSRAGADPGAGEGSSRVPVPLT